MSERVFREADILGAALLDEKFPGWRVRISEWRFNMNNPMACAVCYATSLPFKQGLNELGIEEKDARKFGFAPDSEWTDGQIAEWNRDWHILVFQNCTA